MPSWLPVEVKPIDGVSKEGRERWLLRLTVIAGARAGEVILDPLMREGKAKPLARKKLHGILGRPVSAEEWNNMQPWMIDGVRCWVSVDEEWCDERRGYVPTVQMRRAQDGHGGYWPEWFMDHTVGDDEAWAQLAAGSDFDDLPPQAFGFLSLEEQLEASILIQSHPMFSDEAAYEAACDAMPREAMGYEPMDDFRKD